MTGLVCDGKSLPIAWDAAGVRFRRLLTHNTGI